MIIIVVHKETSDQAEYNTSLDCCATLQTMYSARYTSGLQFIRHVTKIDFNFKKQLMYMPCESCVIRSYKGLESFYLIVCAINGVHVPQLSSLPTPSLYRSVLFGQWGFARRNHQVNPRRSLAVEQFHFPSLYIISA